VIADASDGDARVVSRKERREKRSDARRALFEREDGPGAHDARPRFRTRRSIATSSVVDARLTNLLELPDAHLAHLLQALALRLRGRGEAGGVSATRRRLEMASSS
jgi:hypothetical protein